MIRKSILAAITALALGAAAMPALAGTAFMFLFDNSGGGPDGTIGGPIVGRGIYTTTETLTPGVYALTSLAGFSMSYSFVDGSSFSSSDIATPEDGVALDVTTFGSGLRLVWTEAPGSPDADGGPDSGSLDLVNASNLSFEPSFYGGNKLYYLSGPDSYFFGNYLATSVAVVPENATWLMMLVGFGGLGAALRLRRLKTAGAV